MPSTWIKNYDDIAKTPARQTALDIISAGLDAIETSAVINYAVSLSGDDLKIKNETLDLKNYQRVLVIGCGKAAAAAAETLENILGARISAGGIVDTVTAKTKYIQSFIGTHPKPSAENITASKKITELSSGLTEKDLVIVVVSGGGSALLCWPETECDQNNRLYDAFLKTGGNIDELNTIRKHISAIKGGGLAKMFYPARIIGLVFCDIPGNKYQDVASGPTYQDNTTTADAQKILDKYSLAGFNLNETPKEDEFFKNVTNIPLVSNETALKAMADKAKSLGFIPQILSSEIYDEADEALAKFQSAAVEHNLVVGGGEIKLAVANGGGRGGRNQYLALKALSHIKENELFISLASDGLDNSDAAGAIVDDLTIKKYKALNLNAAEHLAQYNTYGFFSTTGDLIMTGPTGANVSDLMLLLKHD